jgi:hypothetical protein
MDVSVTDSAVRTATRDERWWVVPLPLALVLAVYAMALAVLSPFYEYPVGDDWTYAQAAKTLFEEGRLVIPDPSIASLIFQTVWSYPFLLLAGRFSFAALHLATVTLFAVGVAAWYFLMRELGFRRWLCGFGTALLVFNPFVLPLSVTFQTDVPSLSLMLAATYGYTVWLRSGHLGPLVAGSVLAAFATLVRQSGIVLPIAALCTALGLQALGHRSLRPRDAIVVLGPPVAAVAGLYVWVTFFHGIPLIWKFHTLDVLNLERILRELIVGPFVALHYLALFTLPGLVVLAGSRGAYRALVTQRRCLLAFVALLGVVLVPTAWLALDRSTTMPYFPGDDFLWREFIRVPWGLVTVVTGIGGGIVLLLGGRVAGELLGAVYRRAVAGPWRLRLHRVALGAAAALAVVAGLFALRAGQAWLVGLGERFVAYLYETRGAIGGTHTFPPEYWTSKVPRVYEDVRFAVLLVGFPAAAGLVWLAQTLKTPSGHVPRSAQGGPGSAGHALIYVSGLLFLAFFLITGLVFGRYLVPLLPAAIVLVLTALRRFGGSRALATVVTLAWAVFSTLNGNAVIQFHGAAWKAHQSLLAQGLTPSDIDPGTFTLLGWYIDPERYRLAGRVSRWWVVNDLYRLRLPFQADESLAQGYEVVGAVPFANHLGGEASVVILKKRGL